VGYKKSNYFYCHCDKFKLCFPHVNLTRLHNHSYKRVKEQDIKILMKLQTISKFDIIHVIGCILGYDSFDSHTELSVDRKLPQIIKISYCFHLSFP
jgi:hypothetical protein